MEGLRTRLCNKSEGNSLLYIVDDKGVRIATIETLNRVELVVSTPAGFHIEKPNGFSSKRPTED
jgi:hypothetical protein